MESALKRVDLAAVEVQKSSVTDRRSTSWTHLERLPGAIDRPRWKSFGSLRLVTGASSTPHDTTLNFCLSAQQQKKCFTTKNDSPVLLKISWGDKWKICAKKMKLLKAVSVKKQWRKPPWSFLVLVVLLLQFEFGKTFWNLLVILLLPFQMSCYFCPLPNCMYVKSNWFSWIMIKMKCVQSYLNLLQIIEGIFDPM